MKIGFDGKRAIRNMTGLGNYSRFVVESLASTYPESTFTLYSPAAGDSPRLNGLKKDNIRIVTPGDGGKLSGALWRTWGITKELKPKGIELFHGLSNELPLNIRSSGIPSVVTMHDVLYRRLPHCYNLPDRLIYDFKYGRSARNADRVIAISECTKRDVMEFYGVPEERIDVIYQGCDESFLRVPSREELERVKQRYSLPDRFIIQVGTIEWRKNLELTVMALSSLPEEIHLVAVGRERKGYKTQVMATAQRLGVASRVHFLEGVGFADLPLLYRMAEVSAYPSRYEGFGIPILEAMSSECPVVAATGSCLEEAGGEAALYINPDDARGLASAIVAQMGEKRQERIGKGREHVKKFSNDTVAEHILKTYINTINMYNKYPQN